MVRIDPGVEADVDQALAMLEYGPSRQAEARIAELFESHPDHHAVHYAMGVAYALRKEYAEAVRCFTQAVDIFPHFSEAWYNKASAHAALSQVKETIRAYQKVVEYGAPSDVHVCNARRHLEAMASTVRGTSGLSLAEYLRSHDAFDAAFEKMEARQWTSAIAGFKGVLTIDQRHHQSYGNLGLCYAALGRKQDAIEALNRAIELDPSYEPAILSRLAVKRLAEGEKLDLSEATSINYCSEYPFAGKSLITEKLGLSGKRERSY